MKTTFLSVWIGMLALGGGLTHAAPLGTPFTYQGRLDQNGQPAPDGIYHMIAVLYSEPVGGTLVGSNLVTNLPVTNGLFNADIDFGPAVFLGEARWLELRVRPNSDVAFEPLTPRTRLAPVPNALYASTSGTVTNGAIQISHLGTVGPSPVEGQVLGYKGSSLVWTTPSASGGLTLPYAGAASSADPVFQINNSGSGSSADGILGTTASPSSQASAVRGVATSGSGVVVGVYGRATDSPDGTGIVGYGGATGGYFTSTRPGGRAGVFDGDVAIGGKASIGTLNVGLVSGDLRLADATSEAALGILSVPGWAPVGLQPPTRFIVRREGTVGIGTGDPQATLDVRGTTQTRVLTITGGADIAEPFPLKEDEIEKGSVVIIDDEHPGRLKRSTRAYDTRVAGIVSGANGISPGIALKQEGALDQGENVALTGRVYVQADAAFGAIKPGDLLTTSNTPGHAMKATDSTRAQGAILGKAMTALAEGRGLVLVLVTLQ